MLDNDRILELKREQNLFVSELLPKIRTQIENLEVNAYSMDQLIDFTAIGEEAKSKLNELIKSLKENVIELEALNKDIDGAIERIKNRGANTL